MKATRRGGYTILEGLAAGVILAVALVGMFNIWTVATVRIQKSGEVSQSAQLARAELERTKLFGPKNFPTGTYSQGTSTGTWTGVYDPTANSGAGGWVSGGIAYFDIAGTRLSGANAAGVKFSLQVTVTDSSVLQGPSNTYLVTPTSRRAIVATVRTMPGSVLLFQAGTNLVIGGL